MLFFFSEKNEVKKKVNAYNTVNTSQTYKGQTLFSCKQAQQPAERIRLRDAWCWAWQWKVRGRDGAARHTKP
jgi:hypothetical protein